MKKPVPEDQSRNGVRVAVWRWPDGGTVVEADCRCYGHPFRTHSSVTCPNAEGGAS